MSSKYHTILVEPTLIFDEFPEREFEKYWTSILLGLGVPQNHPEISKFSFETVVSGLELHVQRMIAACACKVYMPAQSSSMWTSPARVKSLLSPSINKRLQYLDKRHSLWTDIEHYFLPISKDINKSSHPDPNKKHFMTHCLDKIVWNFYLLTLATKQECEAPISPTVILNYIDQLLSTKIMSQESKLRLSVIRGIFGLFTSVDAIPGFKFISIKPFPSLLERIDEVLEDAYLLEASTLRKFLSLKTNIKSIKKDLRKLMHFISKNKSWAKGLLSVSSQTISVASAPMQVMEKIIEVIPGLQGECSPPFLIDPEQYMASTKAKLAVTSFRIPFRSRESWGCSPRALR